MSFLTDVAAIMRLLPSAGAASLTGPPNATEGPLGWDIRLDASRAAETQVRPTAAIIWSVEARVEFFSLFHFFSKPFSGVRVSMFDKVDVQLRSDTEFRVLRSSRRRRPWSDKECSDKRYICYRANPCRCGVDYPNCYGVRWKTHQPITRTRVTSWDLAASARGLLLLLHPAACSHPQPRRILQSQFFS